METNPEVKIKYRKIQSLKFLYEISKDGKIRNAKSKKHLSVRISKSGYLEVSIPGQNVKRINRLVAECWIKNISHSDIPLDKLVVNHKDFDKTNNNANNLEWTTQQENIRHDWDNGRREHLRTQLSQMCKTNIANTPKPFNVERAREMGLKEHQRRRELDIVVGGHKCSLICPSGQLIEFKSIGRACKFIAESENVKFTTIYRNLYSRHFAHGYELILN